MYHSIPYHSVHCIVSRALSFTANHTLVVTTCALYAILLLRITSSSSLAPPLPPFLQPPSSLLSIHPSLRTRVQPYRYLLANDYGVCGLPFSMFHIHGVWTRTTGIGLLFFYLSFYFIHSFLFFHSLCANQTVYLRRYLILLFWYVSLFGFDFSFSLVSMLVWSRSRWTVRVGGGLAGVLRERVHRDKVWIGWVFRFL